MKYDYEGKLNITRLRPSHRQRSSIVDQFYSDRSRIIYCSSFRRLQQKAQVFSLEPNSSVRTRLTHSIEVSDLGRSLANKIGYQLLAHHIIDKETMIPEIVAVVENACLLHDIGNPPFGHFGESAIQEWAETNLRPLASASGVEANNLFALLTRDFVEFNGNPQGFRIISKLHCEKDLFSLNLTYATLLCSIKYARAAGEEKGPGIFKKAGYFQSERAQIDRLYQEMQMEEHHRYPLTYIMEAADDIAYCLSDISDGIEKHIVTADQFLDEFIQLWDERYHEPCPMEIPSHVVNFGTDVSVIWARKIIKEGVQNYIDNHDSFYNGDAVQLIPPESLGRVLKVVKQVTRKLLYQSKEAESIELTGYAVLSGLLKHFGRLLSLSYEDFHSLIEDKKSPSGNPLEMEKRLFHRIDTRFVTIYRVESQTLDATDPSFPQREWWLRCHMIIDHISGMTDDSALATYQMLIGIKTSIY